MIKILIDIKTLVIEIISLIIGLIWGFNSNWEYQAILIVAISSIGIIFFIILQIIKKDQDARPRVEIELKYKGNIYSYERIPGVSPKDEPTKIDKEIYGFTFIWKYKLEIKNNSKDIAYSPILHINKEMKSIDISPIPNNLNPIQINKPIILDLKYNKYDQTELGIAKKLNSEKFPKEIRNIKLIISYLDEKRKHTYNTLFIPPRYNDYNLKQINKDYIKIQ